MGLTPPRFCGKVAHVCGRTTTLVLPDMVSIYGPMTSSLVPSRRSMQLGRWTNLDETCPVYLPATCVPCDVTGNIKKVKLVLFNDASRMHWFSYQRLLDIKHMVILTYFYRWTAMSPHRPLFPIMVFFICKFPTDRTVHTTAFDGPVVDHWLDGTEITPNFKWVPFQQDR